jgi:hypothetical protein
MFIVISTLKSWVEAGLKVRVNSLDDAKIIAKWNFQRSYEIWTETSNQLVERYEQFDFSSRKCITCEHIYSEHVHEEKKTNCAEKKCKCKEFKS